MLLNNNEVDVKIKCIEKDTTQTSTVRMMELRMYEDERNN